MILSFRKRLLQPTEQTLLYSKNPIEILNLKPITNKWKSEWSLTSATALIPEEKGRRQFWTLYSIV